MENNLKSIVPSEFKCNPQSRIANSSDKLTELAERTQGMRELEFPF